MATIIRSTPALPDPFGRDLPSGSGSARSASSSPSSTGKGPFADAVAHRHPRYEAWLPTWRELGWLYEGDGPYADGKALIAHPREQVYRELSTGEIDHDDPVGETLKLKRRRQLASYENLAQVVIDTVTEHQYVRSPSRTVTRESSGSGSPDAKPAPSPADDYLAWLNDVDGMGTHIDAWLEHHQALANLYGHLFVVIDRLPSLLDRPARTRSEVAPLALRAYIPPHVPDWLTRRGELVAIKVTDPIERRSLLEPPILINEQDDADVAKDAEVEYRVWDEEGWVRYDANGVQIDSAPHGIGEVPAAIFYSRRRARIPVIGRSFLRDPKVYKDHYNLLSELRELLRSNTFSMLNIRLGPNETAEVAKARLGGYISSESVLFSMGDSTYIAPPDGPVRAYFDAVMRTERAIYRMASLPFENDSLAAEAAESRRMKALGLNRVLSRQADEAERFERKIARLWFILTYGRDAGLKRMEAAGLRISHPDEFFVQQISDVVHEAKELMSVQLGARANRLIRQGVASTGMDDLPTEDQRVIDQDLLDQEARERETNELLEQAREAAAQARMQALGGGPFQTGGGITRPDAGDGGDEDGGGDEGGGGGSGDRQENQPVPVRGTRADRPA